MNKWINEMKKEWRNESNTEKINEKIKIRRKWIIDGKGKPIKREWID